MAEKFFEYGLTIFSCAVIFIWFFIIIGDFRKTIKENPFGDYEEPRTAATLGVLGTFIGISVGLLNFDSSPETMQQSVTNLLGGMRSAFVTSILGMTLSLFLKNLQAKAQKNFVGDVIKSDATISDLISYLQKSENKKAYATKDLLQAVEKMTNSLAGDGDYTVIGQMKIIRQELRDSNDKMISEIRQFGKTLAENNSKAFIEALNETMKDFNQKLTEQFGENFKQLNVAVGRLLEWQENYKTTLESVTQNLKVAFSGIDAAKISLEKISNSSAEISNTAAVIQNLIVTANFYTEKLEQVLAEVQTLGENAKNSVPQIISMVEISCNEIERAAETSANNLNTLSANLTNTSNRALDMANQISKIGNTALNRLEEISKKTINSMAEVSKKIESTSYRQREIMDAEINATKNAVQKIIANFNNENSKVTKTISESLNNMMKTNNENLQKSTENLNRNLEKVLKESLEKFGDTMYKVSAKFVSDYTPLTNKLAELIRISQDAERRAYR